MREPMTIMTVTDDDHTCQVTYPVPMTRAQVCRLVIELSREAYLWTLHVLLGGEEISLPPSIKGGE